jgi:hypothetical protein
MNAWHNGLCYHPFIIAAFYPLGESMEINWSQIGQLLSLGSGPEILVSFLLYVVFFLALIGLFLTPDKNLVATLMTATVLLGALVAKLSIAAARVRGVDEIIPLDDIGMLAINAIMFTFPFIVAGITRKARGSGKTKNVLPMIICGLFAGVYFFMFWLLYQRAA